MSPILSGAIVLGCFLIVVLSADMIVRGAIALARSLKVSPLLIGLTLVAFGTSAPELAIAVQAEVKGAPGQALGNITGSTIASCFLVIGLPALFLPLVTAVPGLTRAAFAAVIASAIFVGILIFGLPFGEPSPIGMLGRPEGLVLLSCLGGYLLFLALVARNPKSDDPAIAEMRTIHELPGLPKSGFSAFGSIILGTAALAIASHFCVGQSISLARLLGVSDERIGLSLLAIGTSLPELAASIIAVIRKRPDLAAGNVLGSVVFNVLGVSGVASLAGPIAIPARLAQFDSLIMLACVLTLAALVILRRKIGVFTGSILLFAYGAYLIGAVLRQSPWAG